MKFLTKKNSFDLTITDNGVLFAGSVEGLSFCNKNAKILDLYITERNVPYTIKTTSHLFGLFQSYTLTKKK